MEVLIYLQDLPCLFGSHLCVFVVTVGGQKHFGYFIHAAQEKRKLWLGYEKAEYIWIFVFSAFRRVIKNNSVKSVLLNVSEYSDIIMLVYLHPLPHTSPGFQLSFLLKNPVERNQKCP